MARFSPWIRNGAIGIAATTVAGAGAFAQTQMSRDPSFCEVYNALGGAPDPRCAGAPGAAPSTGSPGGLTLQGTTQGVRPTTSMMPAPTGSGPGSGAGSAALPARAAASFGSVQFEYNSTNLTREAMGVLDTVGAVLKDSRMAGRSFVIEGHTDASGGPAYNQPLSEKRAQAVAQYLSSRHGIERNRLQAIGKGQSQPADPGNPQAPANRRVVIMNAGA